MVLSNTQKHRRLSVNSPEVLNSTHLANIQCCAKTTESTVKAPRMQLSSQIENGSSHFDCCNREKGPSSYYLPLGQEPMGLWSEASDLRHC